MKKKTSSSYEDIPLPKSENAKTGNLAWHFELLGIRCRQQN